MLPDGLSWSPVDNVSVLIFPIGFKLLARLFGAPLEVVLEVGVVLPRAPLLQIVKIATMEVAFAGTRVIRAQPY